MAVLIKGINKPKNCNACPFVKNKEFSDMGATLIEHTCILTQKWLDMGHDKEVYKICPLIQMEDNEDGG